MGQVDHEGPRALDVEVQVLRTEHAGAVRLVGRGHQEVGGVGAVVLAVYGAVGPSREGFGGFEVDEAGVRDVDGKGFVDSDSVDVPSDFSGVFHGSFVMVMRPWGLVVFRGCCGFILAGVGRLL